VHHATEEFNLTTALRQPFNDFVTPAAFISAIPMAFLFPWPFVSLQLSFSLLYQFWIQYVLMSECYRGITTIVSECCDHSGISVNVLPP
jgi:sterol desaturase/sphingolipid hydroxylase (fatty acid hydroxylase superfamily)